MKDKPTSIRLPNKTIEDIDSICDGVGCSRNEWIKDTLRDGVRRENNQVQVIESNEETKPIESKNKLMEGIMVTIDDGKTWHDVKPIPELTNVTVEN